MSTTTLLQLHVPFFDVPGRVSALLTMLLYAISHVFFFFGPHVCAPIRVETSPSLAMVWTRCEHRAPPRNQFWLPFPLRWKLHA